MVFRANCKRGRMRNRVVVVKKVSVGLLFLSLPCVQSSEFSTPSNHPNDTWRVAKDPVSAASLHSALCHPTIVSLLSSFSAPTGFYQVFEFCENGSLSGFLNARDSHNLTEEELRGVARALVDALVYLKKERVLHRDIKPSNILLMRDFRLVRSHSVADACAFSSPHTRNSLGLVSLPDCSSPIQRRQRFVVHRTTYPRKFPGVADIAFMKHIYLLSIRQGNLSRATLSIYNRLVVCWECVAVLSCRTASVPRTSA